MKATRTAKADKKKHTHEFASRTYMGIVRFVVLFYVGYLVVLLVTNSSFACLSNELLPRLRDVRCVGARVLASERSFVCSFVFWFGSQPLSFHYNAAWQSERISRLRSRALVCVWVFLFFVGPYCCFVVLATRIRPRLAPTELATPSRN